MKVAFVTFIVLVAGFAAGAGWISLQLTGDEGGAVSGQNGRDAT